MLKDTVFKDAAALGKPEPALWSVRTFLVWLVLACLLPGILGAALLFAHEYRDGRADLEKDTIRTARALALTVDSYLLNAHALAQALSTSATIRRQEFAHFHSQAREAVALVSVGSNVVLTDETGQQVANTAVEFGTPLPRHNNQDLFRRVLTTGKPEISDLFYGPVLRRHVMSVDVPVRIDGRTRYVLSVGILPQYFDKILRTPGLPPDWVGAIFDSSGTIVARTHDPERFVGKKTTPEFLKAIQASPEGSMETLTVEGIPVFSVFSRSPASQWKVGIGIPRASLEADLMRQLRLLALGVVGLFAVGLGLAWKVGGRIARSVRALTAPALALGAGTGAPIPSVHIAEAAEVAEAMRKAAGLLEARTAALQHAALHDPLTELPNRSFLNVELHEALLRAGRHQRVAAVLMIDLDHFKPVNDTFGHPTGDEALREIAQRLRDFVRQSDTVARLGGDEFAVVLEDLHDAEEAALVAQGMLDLLQRPVALAGREIAVSGSIGISCYPRDGDTAETLIKKADAAMYLAKEEGRAAYRFHNPELDDQAAHRLFLASSLRGAVARGELVLYYQPRVGATGERPWGAEALVRWKSPEHGLILPSRFIGLAEEIGMIEPIGEWVLRQACTQLAQWQRQGLPVDFVSVNLSPRQFNQTQLAARVAALLQETGLPAAALELEITEGMVMQQPERAEKALRQLADLGVMLSLDDFGTGHSSLAYLQRFPVHHIKLDRSFVQELPQRKDSAAITRAIIAMAKNLELGVTAEGVETEAQRAFLAAAGCDAMQGYLFSRPVSAEELADLMAGDAPSMALRWSGAA